jgi:hypothetical protein
VDVSSRIANPATEKSVGDDVFDRLLKVKFCSELKESKCAFVARYKLCAGTDQWYLYFHLTVKEDFEPRHTTPHDYADLFDFLSGWMGGAVSNTL